MEKLKLVSEIHEPDQRNLLFVRIDTGKPLTIEDHHARVASAVLQPTVPDDVRSYFATIQNLCVYAWFAYDLYAIVEFLCYTAIEMALRIRFPVQGSRKRSLRSLLKEAVTKKLIKPKGFRHLRELRQIQAERLRVDRQIRKASGSQSMKSYRSPIPKTDYAEILERAIPDLRNAFAHPRKQAIVMPGQALLELKITSELINQLFTP